MTFARVFRTPPEVGLSVADGDASDRYTITNKTADGFDSAPTNDGAGVAREITGIAKGYGVAT